jgi:two-component system response regulator NreC
MSVIAPAIPSAPATRSAAAIAGRVIRVVVADDHPIALRGLCALLAEEPDIEVLAACGDADSALASIAEHMPDVAVLDLNMPGRPILDALPELCERSPDLHVVMVTMAPEPAYAAAALEAGATGYVLKEGADADIVAAVRAAVAGERYLTPELAAKVATEAALRRPGGLSRRQLEILSLLALGHTNAQISQRLYLSTRTIEAHRALIQTKLGCRGRHELVEFALEHGLIGPR